MTKRLNMTIEIPRHATRPNRGSIWPLLIASAAFGLTWSGIDRSRVEENGAQMLQSVMTTLRPWVQDVHGYFDGLS